MIGEIARDVVSAVAPGIQERAIRKRRLIGDKGGGVFQLRAISEKGAAVVERAALKSHGELIGQRLFQANMHHAQSREVAILGAERPVENVYIIDQFRRQALELTEIALAVSLARLVLLYVIYEKLQAAIDAAVIEI